VGRKHEGIIVKDKRDLKDDLSLMQTAYAVSLVLGFRNAVECLYGVAFDDSEIQVAILKSLFSVILLLTMMRFFWALGNIRRFIQRNADTLRATRRYIISVHFFILLAHAFSLYLLSKYTLDLSSRIPLLEAIRFLTFGYLGFLFFNSTWLSVLVMGQADREPESVWIKNNLKCATLACVLYLSASFYLSTFVAFLLIVPILLYNSLYDLFKTSSAYVWVDDENASVERARQGGALSVEPPTPSGDSVGSKGPSSVT
jgi:hypothetical protein